MQGATCPPRSWPALACGTALAKARSTGALCAASSCSEGTLQRCLPQCPDLHPGGRPGAQRSPAKDGPVPLLGDIAPQTRLRHHHPTSAVGSNSSGSFELGMPCGEVRPVLSWQEQTWLNKLFPPVQTPQPRAPGITLYTGYAEPHSSRGRGRGPERSNHIEKSQCSVKPDSKGCAHPTLS